jgi:murein DD-endopeptidase MepM/ murein hydrolase activator NlpD
MHDFLHGAGVLPGVEWLGVPPDAPYVRRCLAPLLALAAAAALAPTAGAQTNGGVIYEKPAVLDAPTFTVSPATIGPGARLTLQYRVTGRAKRVRVRVDLLSMLDSSPVATLPLGRRLTGRTYTRRWRPKLAAGRYTARLRATTLRRKGRARASSTSTIEIQQAPVVAASGVFPVQGPYSLGGEGSRFGAKREGHSHQGQDIAAATGTPLVAPRAGFISWRAYQADGAGHYVVLHGDDGRDYVFMHMQGGSVVVQKGQGVAAGQALGAVGQSGHADGPHLHFEIWPDGWYSSKKSKPIDPLPDLLAWAG